MLSFFYLSRWSPSITPLVTISNGSASLEHLYWHLYPSTPSLTPPLSSMVLIVYRLFNQFSYDVYISYSSKILSICQSSMLTTFYYLLIMRTLFSFQLGNCHRHLNIIISPGFNSDRLYVTILSFYWNLMPISAIIRLVGYCCLI